jgi:uncharacterized membrane protein YsdA (DUF1294 family)
MEEVTVMEAVLALVAFGGLFGMWVVVPTLRHKRIAGTDSE